MKKTRCFTAGGLDALESRVVLSQGAASVASGVLHGHKARLVAADFAQFQAAYNSTIVPLAQDMQAAQKSGDYLRAQLDGEAISSQVNSLVNGLGDQLARQLHKHQFARIRAVITGAPSPTTVGLASSSPTPGSLQATLSAMPTDMMTNAAAADGIISVFHNAMIAGNTSPRSKGDFVNFEFSLNNAINPIGGPALTQQQVDASIATVVNGLGTQLSHDLGASAVPDIQSKVTGSVGTASVTLATGGTPAPGSLLATLDSMSVDDLYYWDFINDLALAYASSSPNF